jgi:hypothetical protein
MYLLSFHHSRFGLSDRLIIGLLASMLAGCSAVRQTPVTFGFPEHGRIGGKLVLSWHQTASLAADYRLYDTVWRAFGQTGEARFWIDTSNRLVAIYWDAVTGDSATARMLYRRIDSTLTSAWGPDPLTPYSLPMSSIFRSVRGGEIIYWSEIRGDTVKYSSSWYVPLAEDPEQ